MTRVHLVISGKVQGVGFRAQVCREAQNFGLSGWVRNRSDKKVEIIAEGPRPELKKLVKRCRCGMNVAWVENVTAVWENASGEFVSFRVVY